MKQDGHRRARGAAGVALVLALGVAPAASAEPAADRKAEALFREGRALLERGDVARGCARLAASLEIVRRASTVLNLADCDERQGHLVSSVARWQQGIAMLPASDVRVAVARERLAAVRKRIPRVTVRLTGALPERGSVAVDGAPIPRAEVEGDHQLDPGPHELVATLPGRGEVRRSFTLEEAERRALVLDVGEPQAVAVAPPPRSSGGLRTAGFVLGGVGLASLAVGAVTGALTIDKKRIVDENCTAAACNDVAREAATAGKALSATSTITFVAGGALAAVGLTLVLVGGAAGKAPAAALGAAPLDHGGAVALRGVF